MDKFGKFASYCVVLGIVLLGTASTQAGIIYDIPDSVYQQNFNTLPTGSSAVWTSGSTLVGWYHFNRTISGVFGGSSNRIMASNGNFAPSIFSGSLFSYGTLLATDRALGATPIPDTGAAVVAVAFENQSANPLDSITVTYDGEQWRKGANATAQSLIFAYGFGNEFGNVSSWVEVSSLHFTSPVFNANPATSLNGNAAANRVAGITATISGLDWQVGDTLWMRWLDVENAGDDHSMAIDNFQFSASSVVAVPEPSSILSLSLAGLGMIVFGRHPRKTRARKGVQ